MITLLGFSAAIGIFLLALLSARLVPGTLAVAAFIALQAYVVADHLDGMQALASGTDSPLGEFLDHFSDAVSGAFIGFVTLELMPGVGEGVRNSLLWLFLLAFIITYQERAERRELHFARFGALEGLAIVSVFLATSAFEAGRTFWTSPRLGTLTGDALIIAVAYAAFGGTVVSVVARMRTVSIPFLAHGLSSGALAVAVTWCVGHGAIDPWLAWSLVTAHGAGYLATVMQPHLFGGRPRPDLFASALAGGLLLLSLGADVRWAQGWAILTFSYVVVRAAQSVYVILYAYRGGWVWVNPDP